MSGLAVIPHGSAAAGTATEPVAQAPRQSFPHRGETATRSPSQGVHEVTRWALADPGDNGFSHYIVEQYNTYANSWGVVYYGTGVSYQALLPLTQFTEFRVTAYDAGGQPGPTLYGDGLVPYVADNTATSSPYLTSITKTHDWRQVDAGTAYGHSYLRSAGAGTAFKYCGYFNRLALIAPRKPSGGHASVRVFGAAHAPSFHSPTPRYRDVIGRWGTPAVPGEPAGSGPTHCFKVTAESADPIFVDAVAYNVPDIIE
jgi:hypothetical protein